MNNFQISETQLTQRVDVFMHFYDLSALPRGLNIEGFVHIGLNTSFDYPTVIGTGNAGSVNQAIYIN